MMKLASVLLLLSCGASAAPSSDFDALTRAGFSAVAAAPSSAPAALPAAVRTGGVFLHSSKQGRLYHCGEAGCVPLRASGADLVVSSGKGGVYFTGQAGTGYCDEAACRVLLPGQRVTFPMSAGPRGDVWAANKMGGWHCTPSSCVPAFSDAMQATSNYLQGVYKADGAFVASGDEGTFWCANDRCRRVLSGELLLVEERCAGTPPAGASFGFWGHEVYRCTPAGCALALADDAAVDQYLDCSFDAAGRLLLPRRGAAGSIACSVSGCAPDAAPATRRSDAVAPADSRWTTGADGARYALDESWSHPAPFPGQENARGVVLTREDASGLRSLTLRADEISCFDWIPASSDDDDGPAWRGHCQLVR